MELSVLHNNVNGKTSKKIFELAKEGKVEEAYELQHKANDVIEKVLELGLYQTLKEILKSKRYRCRIL